MQKGSKSANVLERRVKGNPRYSHIPAVVDTGSSLGKYMKMLERLKQNYKFRKDEIFKRIRLSAFVTLMVEVGKEQLSREVLITERDDLGPSKTDEACERNTVVSRQSRTASSSSRPRTSRSSRSTLMSLVNGIGEIDEDEDDETDSQCQQVPKINLTEPIPQVSNPYLLLDVRTDDAYHMCHIITALSYPSAMLARSLDYESKELRENKNKPGVIIILYDEDETVAPRVATTLVQRGYDNIFMLSGGLNLAVKLFPHGLIVGDVSSIQENRLMITGRSTNRTRNGISNRVGAMGDFNKSLNESNLSFLENQLQLLVMTKDVPEYVASRFTPRSTMISTSRVASSIRDRSASAIPTTGRISKPWR